MDAMSRDALISTLLATALIATMCPALAAPPRVAPPVLTSIYPADAAAIEKLPQTRIQLAVRLNRSGYLYCFLQDEKRQVLRVYPNRFATKAWVDASAPVLLPGNGGFGLISPARGAVAELTCVGLSTDTVASWDHRIKGPDLTPMAVDSLADVRFLIGRVSPGVQFTTYLIGAR